jgi:hypothetical protein
MDSSAVELGEEEPALPLTSDGTWPPDVSPTSLSTAGLSGVREAVTAEHPRGRLTAFLWGAGLVAALGGLIGLLFALQ